jgi:hypothetical protein
MVPQTTQTARQTTHHTHLPDPETTLVYRPRRPEKQPLYKILQQNLETFLATAREADPDDDPIPHFVEKTFRQFMRCGIPVWGFARCRCSSCGYDYIVPFSCKRRGLCPSCSAKYMAQTAAHLVDNVIPWTPCRQFVLTVPKRIRYFLQDRDILNAVLRILLRVVESAIRKASPGAPPRSRFGAVVFLQNSGSSLNWHIHFHLIVTFGTFAMNKQTMDGQLADEQDRVRFFPATDFTDTDIDTLTEKVRRRVLRWMAKHGVLDADAADDMLTWKGHGGFSLNASVHVDPWDRSGLERLARYCARPPFAAGRLHQQDEQTVVYELPPGDVHGRTALVLTPFQLIERLVRLIPPPRLHRHRYAGAFAANSPLRSHVIKSAAPDEHLAQRLHHAAQQMDLLDSTQPNNTEQDVPEKEDVAEQPATATATAKTTTKPNKPRSARRASILWAMLIARVYEVLPLVCVRCRSPMKLIAFITEPFTIENILNHIGLPTEPPRLSPARDPPQLTIEFQQQQQPQHTQLYDPYDQTHWP